MQMEFIALRHQVSVYQQSVSRPKLRPSDRLLWAWLSRLWPGWQQALAFVQPRTVIAWQKKRFRDYWRRLSQTRHTWVDPPFPRSPRAHPGHVAIQSHVGLASHCRRTPQARHQRGQIDGGEVSTRVRKPSSPTWKAFLNNHVQDIVACDFFTVPTATFRVLFVFIILAHERRRIVHFNITEHPTAQWTAQQIVEAFPWDTAPRYLLRDRDAIYGEHCQQRIKHMGIEEVKIAPRSPWQNPYCERAHRQYPS